MSSISILKKCKFIPLNFRSCINLNLEILVNVSIVFHLKKKKKRTHVKFIIISIKPLKFHKRINLDS